MHFNNDQLGLGVLAQQIVDLNNQISLAQPRSKRRNNGLKEMEFLTLCHLRHKDFMNVGDIQKLLGVLPAQMSRIIRSLENRDIPLISCRINPADKRKIDVALTEPGNKAFENYQSARVSFVKELLAKLSQEEILDLRRLVDRLTSIVVEASKPFPEYTTV
jgi:DNA-binding MarR family transcriptional regulator